MKVWPFRISENIKLKKFHLKIPNVGNIKLIFLTTQMTNKTTEIINLAK